MAKKRGDIYLLAGLLLLFLIVDIGQATWLLTPPRTRKYVVQPGQTLADIAVHYHVDAEAILKASGLPAGVATEAGQVLSIPLQPLAPLFDWQVQTVGLVSTLLGVLVSFYLVGVAGLVGKDTRWRILAISAAVAFISYITVQASSSEVPAIVTPWLVINSLKDGFAWATCVPLLAKALGFGPA